MLDVDHGALSTADTFVAALRSASHNAAPYDHWLLRNVLPDHVGRGIVDLPFAPPQTLTFDGRRETNNATRVYFSPNNQKGFPVCRELAAALDSFHVRSAIEQVTGAHIMSGRLRIEYCQDGDGFWLEPHVDIPVKLFTMLIYLSGEPELADAGTDIYDATPEHRLVGRAPCSWNTGLIFIPGKDTWHGLSRRPIHGVRKSLIVNYVSPDWRAVDELA